MLFCTGRVGLSTRDSQLSYTKKYDVFNLALGVSALFDYRTLTVGDEWGVGR